MIRFIFIFATLAGLAACGPAETVNPPADRAEIMEMDRKFSAFSETHGAPAAWAEFFARDAVQLNRGSQPMIGFDSILESFADWNEAGQLTWAPEDGVVSASGDLGYTWGRYVYRLTQENGDKVVRQGKYTTIWKRQEKGAWKVVLDIGNQNPPPESSP